MVFYSVILDK